jgi:pimeloyl-ACP methyl ester carboxylesterase
MKKLPLIILNLLLIHPFCNGQSFANINGEQIHYEIKGAGEPWIVLVTGIGRDLNDTDSIFEDLADVTTVLRYSRAGLGKSSWNNPRSDFDQTVNELNDLINELNVPTGFILSGHSYGGLIIRSYTSKNSAKVGGLISLDPNFEDYFQVLEPLNPNTREIINSLIKDFKTENPNRANGSELEASFKIWNSPDRWDDWFNYPTTIPHYLISSLKVTGSQLKGTKEMAKARYDAQLRTVMNADTHLIFGTIDSGHSVHSDQTEMVIDIFKMMIRTVKNR